MSATKRSKEESNGNRRRHRGNQVPADWSAIDADALKGAISSVTASGGAIRFGYTRDGGAYAIGILGDGDPYTDYLRPSDDIVEYLQELAEEFKPQGKLLGSA